MNSGSVGGKTVKTAVVGQGGVGSTSTQKTEGGKDSSSDEVEVGGLAPEQVTTGVGGGCLESALAKLTSAASSLMPATRGGKNAVAGAVAGFSVTSAVVGVCVGVGGNLSPGVATAFALFSGGAGAAVGGLASVVLCNSSPAQHT